MAQFLSDPAVLQYLTGQIGSNEHDETERLSQVSTLPFTKSLTEVQFCSAIAMAKPLTNPGTSCRLDGSLCYYATFGLACNNKAISELDLEENEIWVAFCQFDTNHLLT